MTETVQASLEPHVYKSGEISLVEKLGQRKPKCSQVSISSLVAAACCSLYMCLGACEKSQIKILPHS